MTTVGIDLGTTNSVVAVDGVTVPHAAGLGTSAIVPSVVAFPPNGVTLTGEVAKSRRAIDPKNTIYSAKRLMGQRWLSLDASRFRRDYPFDLVETQTGECAFRTRVGTFSPTQIGSKLISKLLSSRPTLRAQASAVVTVPASFDAASRAATAQAAADGGIERVAIVEEPVATAMAYAVGRNERPRRAAVYDLGGGTFDLAIVDCSVSPARVIHHAGDSHLGGDDIDRAIAHWAAEEVLKAHGWDLQADPETFDRLVGQCERAKIAASNTQEVAIDLTRVDPAAPTDLRELRLTRSKLAALVQPLVGRSLALCDEVLRAASLTVASVDAVYLAGGATAMPVVRESVAAYFGTLPRCELDPMEVVAIGASLSEPRTGRA